MITFEIVYSSRELIEKLRQGYLKDIDSIKIVKIEGCAAELHINVIISNDVYLPITDTCHVKIFENGTFIVTDYNLRNLNRLDKIYRSNLVEKFTGEIMDLLKN
jgi:hypothetical protein